jgi:hypothetical protein
MVGLRLILEVVASVLTIPFGVCTFVALAEERGPGRPYEKNGPTHAGAFAIVGSVIILSAIWL